MSAVLFGVVAVLFSVHVVSLLFTAFSRTFRESCVAIANSRWGIDRVVIESIEWGLVWLCLAILLAREFHHA